MRNCTALITSTFISLRSTSGSILDSELAGIDELELPIVAQPNRITRLWSSAWPRLGAIAIALGLWELGVTVGYLGLWGFCYISFMNAFPRMRVTLMTSPHRDEVQVPVNAETMEPLPAHE